MDALVPDDLWAVIEPLLPSEPEKPKGGRPRSSDRAALAGIILVLRTGMQWKHLPRSDVGCSGKTSWRRLGVWQAAGVWAALHRVMLGQLQDADALDWSRAALDSASLPAKKRGSATGPNPTDRGKPGTKRHLVVDANGTPLGLTLTGANCHDSRMLAATLDAVPGVRTGRRGRPRRRPDKLHADKGYDHRRCRGECRARSITPRIARRGIESSQHLGRYRWIVERTLAWLARFRRLTIRYERRADLHLAFTTLACALICRTQAKRFCP
ncbi:MULTISPECIES: IS5 family transposase [unclassified Methylobacterium]|uniref:IS5 family transposase n=1 Tax=unclassified Methylobacterium TaxID=2615210 RepID=UPI00226A3C60|nr:MULTISPECIES: IS5 family transposase [unclassified Methylobacterium]